MHKMFQSYLMPGFVFTAVIVGGGYATGREIVQFFYPLGPWGGLLGQVVSAVTWSLVLAISFELARITKSYDYRSFIQVVLGRWWFLFEITYVSLLIVVLAVLGAAAGSIAADSAHLPSLAGTLGLMALIGLLVFFGSSVLEKLLSGFAVLLYAIYIAIVLWSFAVLSERIDSNFAAAGLGGGWFTAGITYAGYSTAGIPAVLFCLHHQSSRRETFTSGLLAGPIAMLPGSLLYIAMMGCPPEIGHQSVPITYLLSQLQAPWFRLLFEAVLFGILVKTGTALLHALNERLAAIYVARGTNMPRHHRSAASLVVLVVSIYAAQAVGLVDLIAKGYGTLTYAFIAFLVVPVLTIGAWKVFRRGRIHTEPSRHGAPL